MSRPARIAAGGVLFLCVLTQGLQAQHPMAFAPGDVILGTPREIPYARAFPLLDGIVQDVAAVQLKQLVLDPNAANASSLDAVLQQFQFGAQYSSVAGVQNAAAAQQASANIASAVLQTQVFNLQTQLVSLQLEAQQQVGKAQAAVDSATADQKTAAQQALTLATDNLSSITLQLANLKSLAGSAATPSFNTSTAGLPPALPAPSVTINSPGGSNFTPAFPASKQLDNQITLLWERLARLVSTFALADDPVYKNVYLVEFHTGIHPGKNKRKHELLSTQYTLSCADRNGTALTPTYPPLVLDLFPRSSAVNITDEKFRDSRFGLSALVSFFSVGFNAAYNREHLQVTQALSQSAYITGFGIGTARFGWVFGSALGDDSIAPGDRSTFALVAAGDDCTRTVVSLAQASWDKSPKTADPSTLLVPNPIRRWNTAIGDAPDACPGNCVQAVSYTPTEFDPAAGRAMPVSMDLRLNGVTIDREETVSVDGIFLKRSRDTFGRATAAGGTGGLLESTSIDVNTWIPVSANEMILSLDAATFSKKFPVILLSSPRGTLGVTGHVTDHTTLDIGGVMFACHAGDYCPDRLPAPGRPKANFTRFVAARWAGTSAATDQIVITAAGTVAPGTSQATPGVLPTLQVITDAQNQLWSGRAFVVATQEGHPVEFLAAGSGCNPQGERLVCQTHTLDRSHDITLDVFDAGYAGSPVKGAAVLKRCSGACTEPLIWDMTAPVWDAANSQWVFSLSMINVQNGDTTRFGPVRGANAIRTETFSGCPSIDRPCSVDLHILLSEFSLVTDTMSLQIRSGGANKGDPTVIGNLHSVISPLLVTISDDQSQFTGQNLVFEKIHVGTGGSDKPISCTNAIGCFVPNGFAKSDDGYLFFVTPTGRIPFTILTDKGVQAVPAHHPPKTAAGAGNAPAAAFPATSLSDALRSRQSVAPQLRMFAAK
jgi:hypothetical protein